MDKSLTQRIEKFGANCAHVGFVDDYELRASLSACVAEWLPVDDAASLDENADYFICWNGQFPEYATAWRRGDSWICPSDQRVYLVTPTHYRIATPPPTETEGETK